MAALFARALDSAPVASEDFFDPNLLSQFFASALGQEYLTFFMSFPGMSLSIMPLGECFRARVLLGKRICYLGHDDSFKWLI